MNVTLSSRTDSRRNVFFHHTYRRQALLAHAETLTALRAAHGVVRTTHPFRVEAMAILPDHLHAVWGLTTRLSLLKRHVAHRVRHLLAASQSASRDERRELPCGNGPFGSARHVMTPFIRLLKNLIYDAR
jgi:REP element-mobilizing transposase RayT